jgi:Holliday junction DNA helicase RuvA
MIGRLRGVLVGIRPQQAIVDVAGVGYEVAASPRTLADLPGVGEEVVIHTHLVMRDDGMSLYGFSSEGERDLFRMLLTVSGIGPKVGLSVLGSMSPTELRRAIAAEDADAIAIAPGLGRRGAQKLILELKPKLNDGEAEVVSAGAGDLRRALEGLGYTAAEIRPVMASVDPGLSLPEQVRAALKELGRP